MRRSAYLWLVVIPSLATRVGARELEVPWDSPRATITQTIGVTDVAIAYHRPALAGRDAALLYANPGVWRFGANEATTIAFEHDVTIDGETVAAGRYGFFALPGADAWTLILNKQADMWGSFAYDRGRDALRFDVNPTTGPSVERLEFRVEPVSNTRGRVEFAWGTVRLAFDVDVDTDAIVAAGIEESLKTLAPDDWDTRIGIVKYWGTRGEHLDRADKLADEALALRRNWWSLEWKARIIEKRGRRAEAIPLLEEAIQVSKGRTPPAYTQTLEKQLAEWKT